MAEECDPPSGPDMLHHVSEATSLPAILTSVADKMLSDFTLTKGISHSASKGTAREHDLQREFLDKYLPANVRAVGSGEAISTDGQVSSQCDVMIVDPSTPPLWTNGGYRIVPIECLYSTVEIKSTLTTAELRVAWSAAKRVKSMPKTAFRDSPVALSRTVYGRTYDYCPTSCFVFAYDSSSLPTLGEELMSLARATDPALGIDGVFILNRGYFLWRDPQNDTYSTFRQRDHELVAVNASPGQVLTAMTAHLADGLVTAFMPPFDVLKYLSGEMGRTADRWMPTSEETAP